MAIKIENTEYKVVENLGFNHSVGMYARLVETPDGERMAVKPPGGLWRFYTAEEKIQPGGRGVGQGSVPV